MNESHEERGMRNDGEGRDFISLPGRAATVCSTGVWHRSKVYALY